MTKFLAKIHEPRATDHEPRATDHEPNHPGGGTGEVSGKYLMRA